LIRDFPNNVLGLGAAPLSFLHFVTRTSFFPPPFKPLLKVEVAKSTGPFNQKLLRLFSWQERLAVSGPLVTEVFFFSWVPECPEVEVETA